MAPKRCPPITVVGRSPNIRSSKHLRSDMIEVSAWFTLISNLILPRPKSFNKHYSIICASILKPRFVVVFYADFELDSSKPKHLHKHVLLSKIPILELANMYERPSNCRSSTLRAFPKTNLDPSTYMCTDTILIGLPHIGCPCIVDTLFTGSAL